HRPVSRFVADFIGDSNFFAATVAGATATLPDGSRVPCEPGRTGAATLMVRPESIRLAAGGGSIPGRVVQTSFLGSYVRVAIETAAVGVPVIVALHEATSVPAIGDT